MCPSRDQSEDWLTAAHIPHLQMSDQNIANVVLLWFPLQLSFPSLFFRSPPCLNTLQLSFYYGAAFRTLQFHLFPPRSLSCRLIFMSVRNTHTHTLTHTYTLMHMYMYIRGPIVVSVNRNTTVHVIWTWTWYLDIRGFLLFL